MPVQRRLLIPLAIVLLLLIAGAGTVLVKMQESNLNRSSGQAMLRASGELSFLLAEQAESLAAIEEVIVRDNGLCEALGSRDRQRLLANFKPTFAILRAKYGITHMYFHRPDRVNLLRVHKPEKSGDLIDRKTALEAERTGLAASGIELGPLGTFTLRVVRPVFVNNTLIGYLELGKEIEDILERILEGNHLELAVVIRKDVLDRTAWESGMEMLGRAFEWDRYAGKVLIYSSFAHFPTECDAFVRRVQSADGNVTWKTKFDGKSWRVLAVPLADASGAEVGNLILLDDVSEAHAVLGRLIAVLAVAATILLAGLFVFLYVVLHRVDLGILAEAEELRESEYRFHQLAEQSRTTTWEVDSNGLYSYVSHVTEQVLGYRSDEIVGKMHFYDLHPEDGRETFKTEVFEGFSRNDSIRNLEHLVQTKSGKSLWVNTNGMPVLDAEGNRRGGQIFPHNFRF